jgi:hypothetical protein
MMSHGRRRQSGFRKSLNINDLRLRRLAGARNLLIFNELQHPKKKLRLSAVAPFHNVADRIDEFGSAMDFPKRAAFVGPSVGRIQTLAGLWEATAIERYVAVAIAILNRYDIFIIHKIQNEKNFAAVKRFSKEN